MNVIERAKAVRDMALNDGKGCRCEARGRDECGCDAVWVSPRAAADSITALLSIVERLPKDAEGNIVVHGDRLIGPDGNSYMASGWSWVEPILIGAPKQLAVNCRRPFAAAEAAREGE